jgi:hypothetical protein
LMSTRTTIMLCLIIAVLIVFGIWYLINRLRCS